jgi:hypothetical protein
MSPRKKTFLLLIGSWVIGGLSVGLFRLSENPYYNIRGAIFLGLIYAITWLIWVRALKLESRNLVFGLIVSAVFPFFTWLTTVIFYQFTFLAFYYWKISLSFGVLNYTFTILLDRLGRSST